MGIQMNNDRRLSLSLGCTIAYGMWALSAVLFLGVMATGNVRLCSASLLAIGIAVTATIRTYFVAFSTMVRKAFELDPSEPPPPVHSVSWNR